MLAVGEIAKGAASCGNYTKPGFFSHLIKERAAKGAVRDRPSDALGSKKIRNTEYLNFGEENRYSAFSDDTPLNDAHLGAFHHLSLFAQC